VEVPPPSTVAGLVDAVAHWTERLFPDPDRGQRMTATLRARFGAEPAPLTVASVAAVEAVARRYCRHLDLFFDPSGNLVADREPPGWPPVDPAVVRSAGGYVRCVRRRPDGVGSLRLDQLAPIGQAAPFLVAAFGLLDGATGLVLDLRRNGGGDPATVGMVLDWLLGPAQIHFADVVRRESTRQWWTPGGSLWKVDPGVPVAVLVGRGTFSSAEGLAYFLQSTGRATVIGAVTRGAADHITPLVLGPHIRAHLAEAFYRDPRTGGNWEGTGVVPDIRCVEESAAEVAHRALTAAWSGYLHSSQPATALGHRREPEAHMARIEEIRSRVAEIATTWPEQAPEQVRPYVGELRGYTEEVDSDDHPDAGELSSQIYQLIENIENINGA
jgi:hypothetical protein